MLLLSFAPFLIYGLSSNLSTLRDAKHIHETIQESYSELYTFNNKLYKAKTFLWGGGTTFIESYNVTNELLALKDLLASPI